MTTPAMRALARLRPAHGPAQRHASPSRHTLSLPARRSSAAASITSPSTRRAFTSLRPLTARPQASPTPPPRHRHLLPRTPRRPFSVIPLIESAVSSTETLLATLHTTTHAPWFLTIPLFALALHLATRLPVTIYTRTIALRRARLAPLLFARSSLQMIRFQRQMVALPGGPQPAVAEMGRLGAAAVRAHQGPLYRRWGLQSSKLVVPPLVVFPFWLCGIEALRRMCGGPRGILGTMVFGVGEGAGKGATAATGGAATAAAAETGVADLSSHVTTAAPVDVQSTVAGLGPDVSMATGGCLWFPDLTAADPLHILPFALSALLLLNILPRTIHNIKVMLGDGPPATNVTGVTLWQLRLQRGMVVLALAIGPVTMDLPAALHLYWISSAALTWASTSLARHLMPPPSVPLPGTVGDDRQILLRRADVAVPAQQAPVAKTPDATRPNAKRPTAKKPAAKPAAKSRFERG